METIPGFIWRGAVWAERWKLAGIPKSVQLKSRILNIFGAGSMRDSASKYNTCKMRVDQKDQVITLGVQTYCEKSLTPQPIQSFHKQCEKASSDLCSISAVSRETVCFHMHSVYHTAHWGRLSADAIRYCHQGWACSFLYHSQHFCWYCKLSSENRNYIPARVISEMYLNVGVVLAGGAPLASTALFFAVFIKLWVAKDSNSFSLIDKGYSCHTI